MTTPVLPATRRKILRCLAMDAPETPAQERAAARRQLDKYLTRHGITIEDVRRWDQEDRLGAFGSAALAFAVSWEIRIVQVLVRRFGGTLYGAPGALLLRGPGASVIAGVAGAIVDDIRQEAQRMPRAVLLRAGAQAPVPGMHGFVPQASDRVLRDALAARWGGEVADLMERLPPRPAPPLVAEVTPSAPAHEPAARPSASEATAAGGDAEDPAPAPREPLPAPSLAAAARAAAAAERTRLVASREEAVRRNVVRRLRADSAIPPFAPERVWERLRELGEEPPPTSVDPPLLEKAPR